MAGNSAERNYDTGIFQRILQILRMRQGDVFFYFIILDQTTQMQTKLKELHISKQCDALPNTFL